MTYWITTPEWSGTIAFDGAPVEYHQRRLAKARFRMTQETCIESDDLVYPDGCGTLEVRARWIGYGPRTVTTETSYGSITRSAHVFGHITFNGVRYPGSDLSLGTGQLIIYYG